MSYAKRGMVTAVLVGLLSLVSYQLFALNSIPQGPNQAFVPTFYKAFNGYHSTVTVQNISVSATSLSLTIYDDNGNAVEIINDELPVGASAVYDAMDMTNIEAGFSGTAVVNATEHIQAVNSFYSSTDNSALATASSLTQQMIPILNQANTQTTIAIQNTLDIETNYTIQYYNQDGSSAGNANGLISANTNTEVIVSDPISTETGWAMLQTEEPAVVEIRYNRAGNSIRENAAFEPNPNNYLPRAMYDVINACVTQDSEILLTNPNQSQAAVVLSFYSSDGFSIVNINDIIPPFGTLHLGSSIPSIPAGTTASVVVSSDQAILAQEITFSEGASFDARSYTVPTSFPADSLLQLPDIQFNTQETTNIFIQNTSFSATDVTIEFVERDGSSVASETQLIPAQATVLFDLVGDTLNDFSGSVFITSNSTNAPLRATVDILSTCVENSAVQGQVYEDANNNGQLDAGEDGLTNWLIEAVGQNSGLTFTTTSQSTNTTDAFYALSLPPDTYTISIEQRVGWTQTEPTTQTYLIPLAEGQIADGYHFGLHEAQIANQTIRGRTFNDYNDNGIEDNNETGIPNWVIFAEDTNGNILSTTTDSQGNYEFTGLANGTYTVTEQARIGWIQTAPALGYYLVTLNNDFSVNNDFGNVTPTGHISGQKFYDINADGIKDSGEVGLSNWLIMLENENGTILTQLTDTGGRYAFTDLPAGTYIVTEEMRPIWNQSYPILTHTVTITARQTLEDIDFGNYPDAGTYGSISGQKYNDVNANGSKDATENGLANWTILLEDAFGNVQSTQTDEDGYYTFALLPLGDYTVYEQLNSGWTQISPANGSYMVSVDGDIAGYDFGNAQLDNSSCHIGWDVHLNPEWDYVEVYLSFYNGSSSAGNFVVDIQPLPGLNDFGNATLTPDEPYYVLAGSSSPAINVRLEPLPALNGTTAPYQALITNTNTGRSFACMGQIWSANNNYWIDTASGIIGEGLTFGEAQDLAFTIQNTSNAPQTINFEIDPMLGTNGAGRINTGLVSLNGQPADTPLTGQVVIPAGESATIPFTAELLQDVDAVGDIILYVDSDGDGIIDGASSILLAPDHTTFTLFLPMISTP